MKRKRFTEAQIAFALRQMDRRMLSYPNLTGVYLLLNCSTFCSTFLL